MSWIEDILTQLQGGGAPAAFQPPASPFPDVTAPAAVPAIDPASEAAAAAAARDAAGARMIRSNQRRIDPFGLSGVDNPAVQLQMDQAPAGTGIPVQGSPQFVPFGMPPSVQAAKAMTAPPPPPMAPGSPAPPLPPATDISAQSRGPVGAPMSLAAPPAGAPAPVPAAVAPVAPRENNLALALMGAGAALQGDGGALTASLLKDREAKALIASNKNATARALLGRGAPAEEVNAAVNNPELLKALISKYFETGKPLVVGGHVVRERPGGGLEVLGDFSKDEAKKNPVVKEFTNTDGSVISKQWNPEKSTWDLIPGHEKPGPKDKDRRLSVTDISKLSDEGGKLSQVNTFQSTFRPEFGGWKSNKVGDLVNEAARNLPESVVGKNAAASAAWWQDYDRYKNMVRHEMFGSALTKTETDAFMRADIGPGMTPEQITRNLATQKRVVEGAIRRKGKGLIGSTYDRNAIASAYGVPPEFFDQEDTPAPGRGGTLDIGGQKVQWKLN